MINISCEDNMVLMARCPDKYFDLAIVDPPYGSDNIKGGYTSGKGGGVTKQNQKYTDALWSQSKPDKKYFHELFRISKKVIIWGANHFIENIPNPDSSCWIVWNKKNGGNSFADCELAYTNFETSVRLFEFRWSGMLQENMKDKEIRIHPTQKPVALYKWILDKYAQPDYKILDTHLGSGSIAIACHDYNFDLTACELNQCYFNEALKRIETHTNQVKLL